MHFTVRTESAAPGCRTVITTGELDLASAGRLRHSLLAAANDPAVAAVEVDLGDVTFIDSSGVGALIAARNAADRSGKAFSVVRASDQVIQVLSLLGVGELLGLRRSGEYPPATLYDPGDPSA